MLNIINPFLANPLITKYPKPKQECPINKVLYRVTFRYKAPGYSGSHMYNVTDYNFDFEIRDSKRKIRPGDLVKYVPKNKNDSNYKRLAYITSEKERQINQIKKSSTYNIKFINPLTVNNQIIREKKDIKASNLVLAPQVDAYFCEDSFIPIKLIQDFKTARNAYKNNSQPQKRVLLQNAENKLWNNDFVLDDNNEPMYPKWVPRGDGVSQKKIQKKLNTDITRIVNVAFLPNKARNKPYVTGIKNKWTLNFIMPEGSKPGDVVTFNVNINKNTVVDITIRIPQVVDKHIPQPNEKISAPIEKYLNKSDYKNIKKTKLKDGPDLGFKPTFIEARFAKAPQRNLDKLVKPEANQNFRIKNAEIIKQKDGYNFRFKQLPFFDKNISDLIFDLEVDVELTLSSKKFLTKEEQEKENQLSLKNRLFAKTGRLLQNIVFNGSADCPDKMKNLRHESKKLLHNFIPNKTLKTIRDQVIIKKAKAIKASATDLIKNESRRKANIASGRPGVRSGGRRTRRKHKRTKRKRRYRKKNTRKTKIKYKKRTRRRK